VLQQQKVNACGMGRDPQLYGDISTRLRILKDSHTWFVVGLGNAPETAAYRVARFLQSLGKRIVPIHPRAENVHGEEGFASIADAVAVVGVPDVVDVFVRSSRAGAYVDEAVRVGSRAVWLQLEIIDEDAAERAVAAGVTMIMDACPAIDARR
jgi:uncharacterized protein